MRPDHPQFLKIGDYRWINENSICAIYRDHAGDLRIDTGGSSPWTCLRKYEDGLLAYLEDNLIRGLEEE